MEEMTITQMLENVNAGKEIEWESFDCKETSLKTKTKKLASKVKGIVKEMNLDPDAVTVKFINSKKEGEPMSDHVILDGEGFTITVGFHNPNKYDAGYVNFEINSDDKVEELECPTWRELKSKLKEYAFEAEEDEEDEEVEEAEECNEDCNCCSCEASEEDELEEELEGEFEENETEVAEDEDDNE